MQTLPIYFLLVFFCIQQPLFANNCAFFNSSRGTSQKLRSEIEDLDSSFRDQDKPAPELAPLESQMAQLSRKLKQEVEADEKILSTKEEFRSQEHRDPRMFLKFFSWIWKSPVDVRLESNIATNKSRLETLQYAEAVKDEMISLEEVSNEIKMPHHRDQKILRWVRTQILLDIQEIIEAYNNNEEPPLAAKYDLQLMDQQMDHFLAYLKNVSNRDKEPNPLLAIYAKEKKKRRTDALLQVANTELGRDVSPEILLGIIGAARTTNQTFDHALKMFKEIDQIGMEMFPDGVRGSDNGIRDHEVVILTKIALQNNTSARQIARRFKVIYDRGNDSDTPIRIPPTEATVLVAISYEFKIQAGSVTKRFYEIEALGRKLRDDFILNDASIAYLTRISFKTHPKNFNKSAQEALSKDFNELYDLGSSRLDDFYINDLGVALLYDIKIDFRGNSCEDIIDEFFDVYKTFKNDERCPTLTDENLARTTRFCFFWGASPQWVAKKYSRINEIAGEELSFTRSMTVLGYALLKSNARQNTREPVIEDKDLAEGLTLPYFGRKTAYDFLIDQTNLKRSSVVGIAGHDSYSDTSRVEDSNEWGIGFAVGSDGFKPTMGIGSGMSIDLTDGSLRIGIGSGFSIDTDGDGFGFNF